MKRHHFDVKIPFNYTWYVFAIWESRYWAENPPLYSSLDHNIGCFHHFYLKTYQHSVGLLDTNVSLDKWLYFACFLMLTLVGNRQKNQLWNWSLIPLLCNTVYTIAGYTVSKQTKSHTYLSGLVSYPMIYTLERKKDNYDG